VGNATWLEVGTTTVLFVAFAAVLYLLHYRNRVLYAIEVLRRNHLLANHERIEIDAEEQRLTEFVFVWVSGTYVVWGVIAMLRPPPSGTEGDPDLLLVLAAAAFVSSAGWIIYRTVRVIINLLRWAERYEQDQRAQQDARDVVAEIGQVAPHEEAKENQDGATT
jgi:hypothetical protein